MGTLLGERGVPLPTPGWSAHAIETHPEVVAAIHREYAAAGAGVLVANTFRTQPRVFPDRWRNLTRRAVDLCRGAAGGRLVAGSIAPIEDCYRPDLSPTDPRPLHQEMARELAAAGCDLLLCETFPSPREGLIAAEEALATGLPTWLSFTAGPDGALLRPEEVGRAARDGIGLGVRAVLVNCVAASRTLPYVNALAEVAGDTRFGAYANAGGRAEGIGWGDPAGPRRYADLAEEWIRAGATMVGSCCGTGPAHTSELVQRFGH
jgi:S-methylmethionine-dependent homocysteine/selenocysteine methylase